MAREGAVFFVLGGKSSGCSVDDVRRAHAGVGDKLADVDTHRHVCYTSALFVAEL